MCSVFNSTYLACVLARTTRLFAAGGDSIPWHLPSLTASMSSFKRKNPAKAKTTSHVGTRVSAASASTINVSTGIPSLDDLLGGGLPLSCSFVIAAPDLHSSYGQLVQKYYASEGLASGHRVCIIDSNPEAFINDAMWFPKSMQQKEEPKGAASDEEDSGSSNDKVKIAWRYEQMKQFQTTVNEQ